MSVLSFELKLKDFKKGFVDTTKKKTENGVNRGLIYMGGFIKKVAQRSIKNAAKHTKKMQKTFIQGGDGEVYSRPGQPPLNKTGLLKTKIYSSFNYGTRVVTIGPAKLNGRGNVPAALEFGGVCVGLASVLDGPPGKQRRVFVPKTYYMQARPYMRPALKVALQRKNLLKFFKRLTVPSSIMVMQG